MSSFRSITVILIASLTCVSGWTNEEFEMFDLVEELGSVTLYDFLGVTRVSRRIIIYNLKTESQIMDINCNSISPFLGILS